MKPQKEKHEFALLFDQSFIKEEADDTLRPQLNRSSKLIGEQGFENYLEAKKIFELTSLLKL